MATTSSPVKPAEPTAATWREAIKPYVHPDERRSWAQVLNSLLPYLALWALMLWSLRISYWVTLLLAVPAAGFLVRLFIIFHDCGHGSFFRSRRLNDAVGIVTGLLVFTPYYRWRHDHAVHHATAGDLDRRGIGDVWTLTVDEYLARTPWQRFVYRLYRHPLAMLVIAPPFAFLIGQRFTPKGANDVGRRSVRWTNLVLAGLVVGASLLMGAREFVLIQLPVIWLASSAGIWLFYVQHQFEGAYWSNHEEWDYVQAALAGSSFYRLPRLLQWFSGNIGFHHIHHLSPRIPNYNLEPCHEANPIFHDVPTISLRSSLASLRFRLWDPENQRMVGFDALRQHLVEPVST